MVTPAGHPGTPRPQAGDSCRRILTGYGNCGEEYDLLFCVKHATLETVTRTLPLSDAIAVWADAVSSNYDALAGKVPADTAGLLKIDQLLFTQQLDAYKEFMLQQLKERCIDLCYAIHQAPAARPDSILQAGVPVLSAQGERASLCGRTIEPISGGYHITETVCRTHDFIPSGLKLRLQDKTQEEKVAAFDESRYLWMSILMKESNELYATLSPEGQTAMSGSLNLFQGWLNTRRDVLLALYPDDAAVAAELLSYTVHSRMLDLEVLTQE